MTISNAIIKENDITLLETDGAYVNFDPIQTRWFNGSLKAPKETQTKLCRTQLSGITIEIKLKEGQILNLSPSNFSTCSRPGEFLFSGYVDDSELPSVLDQFDLESWPIAN